jgi:hypothetical protein
MKLKKIQALGLASLMLCTNTIYANTTNNLEISSEYDDSTEETVITGNIVPGDYDNILIGTRASESQTLTDTDGDGYFAVKFPSKTSKARFSLANHGKARVEVVVYEATSGNTIWSARVNGGGSATSATLTLPAGKYCFEVVSDDGSALNVTCTARY